MNSQKHITIAACAMFIMLGILCCGILKTENRDEAHPTSDADVSASAEAEVATEDEAEYTLKIHDGVLVVFSEADDIRPIIVTDVYASTLRHMDREMLAEGITVNGEVQMQSLLEDFSS